MAFVKFLKSKSFSSSPIWNAVSAMTIGKVREFIFCVKGNSLCTFIGEENVCYNLRSVCRFSFNFINGQTFKRICYL